MIHNDAEFEEALEQVSRYLERPPRDGSAEDAEFSRLLEAIGRYQPAVSTPRARSALSQISERAEELVREADRLHGLVRSHTTTHLLSIPGDGRGMGPTTGAPRQV